MELKSNYTKNIQTFQNQFYTYRINSTPPKVKPNIHHSQQIPPLTNKLTTNIYL